MDLTLIYPHQKEFPFLGIQIENGYKIVSNKRKPVNAEIHLLTYSQRTGYTTRLIRS